MMLAVLEKLFHLSQYPPSIDGRHLLDPKVDGRRILESEFPISLPLELLGFPLEQLLQSHQLQR